MWQLLDPPGLGIPRSRPFRRTKGAETESFVGSGWTFRPASGRLSRDHCKTIVIPAEAEIQRDVHLAPPLSFRHFPRSRGKPGLSGSVRR